MAAERLDKGSALFHINGNFHSVYTVISQIEYVTILPIRHEFYITFQFQLFLYNMVSCTQTGDNKGITGCKTCIKMT